MAISADQRLELRELAQAAWGERGADLLMAGLASADLEATEERLTLRIDGVRTELRGEMAELRGEFGELKGEFAELKGEMHRELGELRGEFGELRGEFGELKGRFGELQGYVGMEIGAIRGEIGKQNRLFFVSIIASFAAVAAIVFGALQAAG